MTIKTTTLPGLNKNIKYTSEFLDELKKEYDKMKRRREAYANGGRYASLKRKTRFTAPALIITKDKTMDESP